MDQEKPIVLIVDDSEAKRYALARYLKAAGFLIWETTSGEEALRLAQNQPSVIALDVNLPDILGYEVSRRLRSNPKTAGIPIVQISATFTTPNSRIQGLDSGADSYLTGPVQPEELVATMKAMIRMRQAEVRAREYAAQWQASFDAISDAVLVINSDGNIQRCNRAFATLMGHPPEAIVGRNLSEVTGPGVVDPAVYFRMLGSRRRESVERQFSEDWFSISADPVVDPQGDFMGGVLIISRITDRKRAEEARQREQLLLQQDAERLEAKVQERTRQLEESVKALEGFCYTIAHDLRSPLRAVNGMTSELLIQYSACFDQPGKALVGRITSAANRMDRLIEELLAFGRLSNSDLPRRLVHLEFPFQGAVLQLTEQIKEKHAVVEICSPLPSVWANPTILEQIAVNLIANAVKFNTPGANPKVSVWAEHRGEMVRVWVEDNGIGIESAYHRKIFGLFERLHTDKQYRGTGIGLAIVQKGVERMGGTAGVESEPLKGSRFWIELPGRQPQ